MEDSFLFEQVQLKYPEASKCVEKILFYLSESRKTNLDIDEIAYLTLHVQRLIDN